MTDQDVLVYTMCLVGFQQPTVYVRACGERFYVFVVACLNPTFVFGLDNLDFGLFGAPFV